MKRYGYWLLAGLLYLGANAHAQEQKSEDYVQEVTADLQQKTGKAPQPQEIVGTLNRVVVQILKKGDYRTGEIAAEQTYRFAEQKLGPKHLDTLASVNNLASLYRVQGRYGEAEPLYQRALAGCEKALGPEHPDTLTSVNNLAGLYQAQGRYGEAEPLYQRALAAREKVLGPEHPDTLTSVGSIALLYKIQGRYGEAEPLYQRALAASEKVLGSEHPDTLTSLDGLAELYRAQGRYEEAESLHRRVLVGCEKVLGPEHPDTLASASNLASLYKDQGRYGEAESLYRRELAASEKVLGPEHPNTLTSVNNLAGLYQAQGRYGEAEPLYQRALAAREKVLGPEHPDTLTSVGSIALLYKIQGRYEEAEPLYRRELAASEKVLGSEHPDTLTSVNNLAGLYQAQGRYGEAEPLYQRALAAREKVLGPEHPDTLISVNNLASLYVNQGSYGEAEPLFRRALAASEKVLGPEHPDTLLVQLNYTVTLVNLKQPKRALQLLKGMEPRLLELAALQLRHTRQERVRRMFLTSQANFQDAVLTLALSHPEPEYLDLAAKVMLRWKQIQGEEEAFLARLVRRRGEKDTEIRELARQIAELRRDLSHLVNLPKPDADLQHNKLNELEAKEIRLAQISREFNRHLQVRGANVDDVRHYLPRDGGALLELRVYEPFDFKTGKSSELHWAALLLPAAGELSLHDLGPVAETQDLVQKLRATHARADAATLYHHLFGKLDEKLKGYDSLYIAPDGVLSLLAFAELVTPDGRYWLQRQTLRQVATGRHLIAAYDRDLDKPKGLLALGGVNYAGFGAVKEPTPQQPKPTDQNLTVALRAVSNEIGQFKKLDETGNEAKEVANAYWSYWNIPAQVWLDKDASEYRLKTLATPPRVLHLATHGFYLSEKSGIVDRPMVLSGLALAGANQGLKGEAGPDGEDGILYALEVQDLNLEDTELVTLSACDTGKGTLDYSEGVYGLVRAFHTAGARNVLMSLWPLGDHSAREFMARFYRNWLNGPKPKDLAVALRETQLSFIQDDNEQLRDPRVWAPFVLVEGP